MLDSIPADTPLKPASPCLKDNFSFPQVIQDVFQRYVAPGEELLARGFQGLKAGPRRAEMVDHEEHKRISFPNVAGILAVAIKEQDFGFLAGRGVCRRP